jgi:hypothetical protein
MRKLYLLGGAVGVLGLSACTDLLAVKNLNNPDVARAYATVDGVEGVVAGLGSGLYNGNGQRSNEGTNTQSKILAGESHTSVNNFGGAPRSAIPRSPINNSLGNDIETGNLVLFNRFSVLTRTAANAIAAVDRLNTPPGVGLGTPGRTQRARAFGYFILGQALANLAAAYDSAAIVTPDLPSDSVPGLSSYVDVNAAAVRMLDSALAATQIGSGIDALPTTWLSSTGWTNANFARLIRSMRARVRTGAARTPTEAAAIDWAAVIADGTNGITADFTQDVGGTTGWTGGYHTVQSYVASTWAWAPMYYYGMADVSGGYSTWLSQPRDSRSQFLVITPDTRWPQGATRAAQQAEAGPATVQLPAGRYMRNRPTGDDPPASGWGQSMYDHRRWGFIRQNANTGTLVEMDVDESRLYAAEGYIRTGQFALAAPLINQSRAAAGLPAVGVVDGTSPVAGGASCVPQVPVAPSFTSASCGNMWEAMKYEMRMESAWTGYMAWFRHHRRWGDMIEGTPLEWPVPYQEMQARRQEFYNGTLVAGSGTYQFGNGANK